MSTCTLIRRRADRPISRVLVALTLSLILAGCATCERHPVACAAAVGVVGTSIALSVNRHHEANNPVGPERAACGRVAC